LNDENASYSHSVLGLGSPLKRPIVIAAQDAAFTLDGIDYTRTSNTVTDALSGITINLIKSDTNSQSISVNKGADKTPQVIQGLVDSYNDLVATAKKLSAKSSPSSTASTDGSLANSPTALSFLSQIKAMLVGDIHYSLAGTDGTLSLGDLGFEMQFDGTVKFNQTTLNGTKNASAILASGIQVGYATYVERDPDTGEIVSKVTTDVTLDSYLNSLLKATKSDDGAIAGAFDRMIANERSSLSEMNKKQTSLQIRLDEKQKSLYSQYSALNALLFKLSNTSNSLTNALSGLTNGQNNN
jgi:flagellar hook-associated protein 2